MPALTEVPRERWDAILAERGVSDVYYTRGYVEASAVLAAGEPTMLHLGASGGDVFFPCLVRGDPTDVVTPYGYGGPLAVGPHPPVDAFAEAYESWCRRRGVVSSFVAFHPLLGNARIAPDTFHRRALAGTVAWSLAAPDLLAGMHRHHRRVVRRAVAEGLRATVHEAPADLDGFVDLYEQTMSRNRASPYYFFPAAYWDALARGVRLVRVDVTDGERLLAGVLGMGDPPWLHYHLGGSAPAGTRLGASHLALYALAEWGRASGYEVLHLGGGVGGRDDSLLLFKHRFAPGGRVAMSVGAAVHDRTRYLELAGADEVDWDGFFPAYRAPR